VRAATTLAAPRALLAAGLALVAAGCGPAPLELTGAGGSFPAPVYAQWATSYAAATGVRVNYQPIGSGGGLRQVADRTVDFGGTDVPRPAGVTAGRPSASPLDARVAYVPMLLGAVAVTYHLPGLDRPLRLSPEALADLFLGRIARWDDPRLAALNPGARLPALDVLVVHRAEGSGTTYIVTDYLSAVSPAWRDAAGRGTSVRWAAGVGVRGNDGVSGLVGQTPGAVGYVEAAYATRAGLPAALLRNRAGIFVPPSPVGAEAAAAAVTGGLASGADLRVSLVDAPGRASYPLASFTWLLLDRRPREPARTRAVASFARWALAHGDATARALGYAPLPAPLAARADTELAALGGMPAGAAAGRLAERRP
jgi:phosphate transport system substrate-binding protein